MKKIAFIFLIFTLILSFVACNDTYSFLSNKPVTLTLWHNYGGQLKETMDRMIDEFNETIGDEEGIIISVTSISGSETIHEKLTMAANEDPGAPILPDITTAYPNTAQILAQKGKLVDLDKYFTPIELSAYIPEFLQEGRIMGDSLYVFPTAKSTETLFVNTTIFNRFSQDTGAKLQDLKTFEGLNKTAELYFKWTDDKTPDIKGDGKTLYMPDSIFNFSLIGMKQLGEEFIKGDTLNTYGEQFKRVWEYYFKSAVLGQTAIFDGYATDLAKTGDIVCSTGSTAGVSFFSPTVTYPDNTSEEAELAILPYPIFEGGQKIAIQRGAGMCITKSTEEKAELASIFLKWFTKPENNIRFVSSTGYLPVTEDAYGELMSEEIKNIPDKDIKRLLETIKEMQNEYHFEISPLFEGKDDLVESYEDKLREISTQCRDSYRELEKTMDPQKAYDIVADRGYNDFLEEFLLE